MTLTTWELFTDCETQIKIDSLIYLDAKMFEILMKWLFFAVVDMLCCDFVSKKLHGVEDIYDLHKNEINLYFLSKNMFQTILCYANMFLFLIF